MLLFIILLILFSIPTVQTFVARKITKSINESRDVNISIGRVGLTYNGKVRLGEVLIRDHHDDTLIFADKVRTSLTSFANLKNNTPSLGDTQVEQLKMDMKIYKGEELDNLRIFLNKLKSEQKSSGKEFILTASDLEISNSRFSYYNENLQNPEIVNINGLNINAENFLLKNSDVYVDIQKLSGIESRGLEIKSLSTVFKYTAKEMALSNLELQTPQSSITADIAFDIRNGFGNFVNSVPISADFSEASVSTNDLRPFYDKFGANQRIEFTTELNGVLNDFHLTNLEMSGLDRTVLRGDLVLKNVLPKEDGIFSLDGRVNRLAINYYDLINLLPELLQDKLPNELRELGNVEMNGDVFVSEETLVTDAVFLSQLGRVEADFVMNNISDPGATDYKGSLLVENFNVGKLLNLQNFGKTSLNLNFNGSGFSEETLNTEVRGSVSKLVYNGYAYNNIKVRGTLRAPVFNGNLISLDPNLRMEFNGLADFSSDTNVYDFEANVEYADLQALNLVKRDTVSVFKGDIIMNMRGTNLNNAAGDFLLLNTSYQNENDTYVFNDLKVTSTFNGPVRTIEVFSPDVISGSVEGVFDVSQVPALVENAVGSLYTNYRPNKITTNQYLNFNFDIYNKIVEVFYPEITLAPNTFIRGSVESDESEFQIGLSFS